MDDQFNSNPNKVPIALKLLLLAALGLAVYAFFAFGGKS